MGKGVGMSLLSRIQAEAVRKSTGKLAYAIKMSSSVAAVDKEEDYGLIRPSLIKQLKSVLDQYPDNGQILKELLQNAEDAGAQHVQFLFDKNSYPCTKLHHPDLAAFQGPAIYAYNDAQFTEHDWTGIRMLQDSIKESDSTKIGRFGLGFKSVFHLTDLPSVLSGERLFFIDPHERYFLYQGSRTSGYLWNISERQAEMQRIPHQFAPFSAGIFGCSGDVLKKGYFPGTMFRFPLRKAPSELSSTIYDDDRVNALFDQFKKEARLVLIFLKNVSVVEICIRADESQETRVSFRAEISAACRDEVRGCRRRLIDAIKSRALENISVTYLVIVDLTHTDASIVRQSFRYLVNEYYAGGQINTTLTQLRDDAALSLVPVVGTAVDMDGEKDDPSEEIVIQDSIAPRGHVFCSLPLAAQEKSSTGFPVHVNGFFAVTQNRQDLKWPVSGQRVEADKCLMWNQCLIKELIPRSYRDLILYAIRSAKLHPKQVYTALPDMVKVDEKWQAVLEPLYNSLFKQHMFHTQRHHGKGEWMKLSDCVLDRLHHEDAVTRTLIVSVLVDAGVAIATDVGNHIIFALGAFGQAPEIIMPGLVRDALRSHSTSYVHLPRSAKLRLLSYTLKDSDFRDMYELDLLPLANGSFTQISCKKGSSRLFIPTEEFPALLLPTLTSLLIDCDDIDEQLLYKLKKMALSECTQVTHLTKEAVCELLPKVIPKAWYQQLCVNWKPLAESFSDEWLITLWIFLRTHYPSSLSRFRGHPILPVFLESTVRLVPIMADTCVVLRSGAGATLSSGMVNVLQHFNVIVVDDLPQYVRDHAEVMGNYVRLPIADDLIEVMYNGAKLGGEALAAKSFRTETTESEKAELRELISWLQPRSLHSHLTAFLRRLPIFKCTSSIAADGTGLVFCSVEEVGKVAPAHQLPFATHARYLSVAGDDIATKAAAILGAKFVNITSVLLDTFTSSELDKGFSDESTANSVARTIFENFSIYVAEDPNIVSILSKVPFVQTCQPGKYVVPSSLFDPDEPGIRHALADNATLFPLGYCALKENLVHLRRLGLKSSEHVTAGDLLTSMLRIESLIKTVDTCTLARTSSLALIHFLDRFSSLLFEETNGRLLVEWACDIVWVATVVEKPSSYPSGISWCGADGMLRAPADVTSCEWCTVVGAVQPVVSCNAKVAQAFGWDERPSVKNIVRQLISVSSTYCSSEKVRYLSLIVDIFDALRQFDCKSVLAAFDEHSSLSLIWHGDGFTSRDRMIIKKPITDLRPYMYSMPSEMQPFGEFLVECGVLESCSAETYLRLLADMRRKYDDAGECSSEDAASDIQLAVTILNELAHQTLTPDQYQDLLVICQTQNERLIPFVLLPIRECTYCDVDWLRRGFDITEFDAKDGISFIHPQLPTATAAAIGVPTLMSRMLHAEELTVTSFGQSEPLTNRLHKLLEDYTDGLAIPKEIIQNADDAGGSEVRFAYDERSNNDSMKYLIDEGMRNCQGPALWAYNDATFTERDFESITRLGGAMKESDLDKIGRFGLGFNSVYNITDLPSFVTRSVLVIFDPHTTHLGRGIRDRSRPGIRINLDQNRMLLRRLPDQFKPYEGVFGCHLNKPEEDPVHFNGTLFRLPLRSREQAARSEISNLHYDSSRVFSLVQLLAQNAHNLLIFTQNVRRVSFYHIPADGDPNEPLLLFSISKNMMTVIRELECPNFDWMKNLTSGAVKTEQDVALSRNSGYLRAAADYTKLVSSENGMVKKGLKSPRASIVIKISVEINEVAEFMGLLRKDSGESFWLVSSCLGSQCSMDMALSRLKDGLVPAAGIACLLEPRGNNKYVFKSLGHGVAASRGRAYCYMPLPVITGLPVHINGVFALHSNRRQLSRITEDERTSVHVDWNQVLLEDAVLSAYVQMLTDLEAIIPVEIDCPVYNAWPLQSSVDVYFESFVRKFYKCAVQSNGVPLLYRQSKPVTFDNVVFLEGSIAGSELTSHAVQEVFHAISDGKTVCLLNNAIYTSLLTVGLEDSVHKRLYSVDRFYSEVFFPNLDVIPPKSLRSLVLFAVDLRKQSIDALLANHSCIPSSPDGAVLRRPCELVHPTSEAACLYSPNDGRFPHAVHFQDVKVLGALERLGLVVSDLGWSDVIERCTSLQSTWSLDKSLARSRQQVLMLFLDRLLLRFATNSHQIDESVFERLSTTPILLVKAKPADFPLKWAGDSQVEQLMSAAEMFMNDFRHLVSATCCIVDDSRLSARVREFLRLADNRPRLEHVITQMEHALAVDLTSLNARQLGEFQRCMYSIYAFLQDACMNDPIVADHITTVLANRPCILLDRTLVPSNQVAIDFPYNCSPFLYCLPADIAGKFPSLMSMLGVKRRFELGSFVRVINELNSKSNGQPLGEKDLDMAVRMVTQLNDSMKLSNTTAAEVERCHGVILVPNAAGCLAPAKSLCYNDCPWLNDAKLVSFVHPGVTYQSSVCLGVKTKRREALREYSRGIPFGQKERLTNSLRRLLDSYPLDHEILKEFVQNADDAGATEIHFVIDNRYHSDVRVFDVSWRSLQGPALCIYNNRQFSDVDLEGIQQFGEGSKSRDPASTGQYGIGFSSVYHLTDVPSLLTSKVDGDKMLCVFDPMCKYIPGATMAEPGMRYDNIEPLKTAFPDVFSCYMEDCFPSGGTIFRLPFRTRQMADVSEISKTVVTPARVQSILDKLKEEAFELLLFTNCLEELSVSEVDPNNGNLTNTYTVKTLLSKEDRISRQRLVESKRKMAIDGKTDLIDIIRTTKPSEVVLTMLVTDNRGYQEKWTVCHRLGFDVDLKIPSDIETAFLNGEMTLLPYGGVACQVETRINGRVSSSSRPSRAFCFLPLPVETDLPVHINGHFALGYENRRHLWTNSERAGCCKRMWNDLLCEAVVAPAYVELLRTLRTKGLNCTIVSENQTRVTCSRQMLDSALQAFMAFFPGYSSTKPEWAVLSTAVYRRIERDSVAVLVSVCERDIEDRTTAAAASSRQNSVNDARSWQLTWFPPVFDNSRRVFFRRTDVSPDSYAAAKQTSLIGKFKGWFGMASMTNASPERRAEEIVEEVLLGCGLKLVEATPQLHQNFRQAGVQVDYMTAESVLAFFGGDDDSACLLNELPNKVEETPFHDDKTFSVVFNYVSSANDFYNQLDGLPLLLMANGTIDRFSKESPVFCSEFSDLLSNSGHLFTKWVTFPGFCGSAIVDLDVFRDFSLVNLADLLTTMIPAGLFCQDTGFVTWQKSSTSMPTAVWISRLWAFIKTQYDKAIDSIDDKTQQARHTVFQDLMIPLKDWCVVPARSYSGSFLFSPSTASGMVVDVRNPSGDHRLIGLLIQRMKFPEIDWNAMHLNSDVDPEFVSCLAVTLDKPYELLVLLHRRLSDLDQQKELAVLLTNENCHHFLKYFTASVDALKAEGADDACDLLRDLPIYKTICGDIIRLTGCFVYTLPEKIPTNGIDVWQSRSGTVFLACNDAIEPLYDFLGCAPVGPLDVYCRFIFQHFEYFPRDDRLVHVHHVYMQYLKPNRGGSILSDDERESLIESLRGLAFLEDADGELQPAGYFYDPENVVFRVMLPDGRFAPAASRHFKDSEWYSLLGLLGMVRTVTSEKFYEFSKIVASESANASAGDPAAALTKSKVLIKYLYSTPELLHDPVIDDIAGVPFIAPESLPISLTTLHPQYGDINNDRRIPFIALRDAVPREHTQLCWTSANLLPSWAGPASLDVSPEEQSWVADRLQIQQKPRLDTVIRHLRNLCGDGNSTEQRGLSAALRASKTAIFRENYRFLDDAELDDDTAESLGKIACVLVDDGLRLIVPARTVVNMYDSDEIRPYLYRLPLDLGQHRRLFLRIGASDRATVVQYVAVLAAIRSDAGKDKLTPNELVATYRAVRGLLSVLDSSMIQQKDVGSMVLYMPSEDGRLVDAARLVFNDAPAYFDRVREYNLRFVADLRDCIVGKTRSETAAIDDLLAQLPSSMRPAMLSVIVQETLVESCRRSTSKTGGLAERIGDRLRSDQYSRAVVRLVRHEGHKSGRKVDDSTIFTVLDRLSTIVVLGAPRITTHLLLKGRPIAGSEMEKSCFVERGASAIPDVQCWNIFIKDDTVNGPAGGSKQNAPISQDLLISLAETVNSILSGILHDSVLYLLPALSCANADDIDACMDSLNVRVDHSSRLSTSTSGSGPGTGRLTTVIPPVGSPVGDDVKLLCRPCKSMDGSMLDFRPGEYIGYSQDQPDGDDVIVYGVVLEELMSPDTTDHVFLIDLGSGRNGVIASLNRMHKFARQ